ncbi:MAG TPA: hypothetical protein VHK69_09795 [Chitinophagaceae bacterium]|jgi:hypothetical protein|nr:hypothetical protein [Chitinophagaceae bacterium]
MKKLFMSALVLAGLMMTTESNAQNVKGVTYVNAGIGIGAFNFIGTGGLPIVASAEHGITDKISAGVVGSIVSRKYFGWKYNYVVVGVRGSYHVNELLKLTDEKLEVYGGASLFYRGYKVKWTGHDDEDINYKSSGGGLDIALHAGGRYFFTEKIGGFAEVGYGISPLQLGLTVKF